MKTLVLGIETSCDETAAAVVTGDREILSNIIFSQIDDHKDFGGVVPEVSARQHLKHLPNIIKQALSEANIEAKDLSAVAATSGPGLIGGLIVGSMLGRSLAFSEGKPFIAINHLEGHALTARLTNNVSFPFMLLLVSGGHTQIILVEDVGRYVLLGSTLDDALGETFDKVAKMMDLSYPGGPALESLALKGDERAFEFPVPLIGRKDCAFSFSGLKTAVRYTIQAEKELSLSVKQNIAASFQRVVKKVLTKKLEIAMDRYPKIKNLVVAGGVASNQEIRKALEALCEAKDKQLFLPPPRLCTDNAAMIAWAGVERFMKNDMSSYDFAPRPRWPLAEL